MITVIDRAKPWLMPSSTLAALRAKGFKAVRLEDGFPERKAAGLAVEAEGVECRAHRLVLSQ
ncbi:hypothetical protein [Burkholderia ubonensis]|uniref:hypothetical protein n=1 Tax=Burkholderia ubonensis TaxID=101571 RepID=UPI0013900D27|nr:hypothetical protein [Burkholderia ubonensis]